MKRFLSYAAMAACMVQLAITCTRASGSAEYTPGLALGKADRLHNVSGLAIGKDDFLVVADVNKVLIYDPAKEQSVRSFNSGFPMITAVAVEGDIIYVFSKKFEIKDMEYQGRKYQKMVPLGALCKTFQWDGTPIGDITLENLKDVVNAKVVNGVIYAADYGDTRKVCSFDAKTGKAINTYGKNLRLCCGILDFTVDPKNDEMLIANLGAFKLERYDSRGSFIASFGERGEGAGDFHGCCNPVSVGILPGDNLVLVEKDPSRVRIFSGNGKMLSEFPNLEQLVEGCSRVSLAVDSQGRVYLGVNAGQHYVVQYVPKS